MDNEIITSDWGQFGYREIEEAKELLSHIKEIESYGKVEVLFNTHSGYVFLSDEDYKTWMMNGDKIEEWYSCPECCHEGFLEDMEHEPEGEECTRYMKEINGMVPLDYKDWTTIKEGVVENSEAPNYKSAVRLERNKSIFRIIVTGCYPRGYTKEAEAVRKYEWLTRLV